MQSNNLSSLNLALGAALGWALTLALALALGSAFALAFCFRFGLCLLRLVFGGFVVDLLFGGSVVDLTVAWESSNKVWATWRGSIGCLLLTVCKLKDSCNCRPPSTLAAMAADTAVLSPLVAKLSKPEEAADDRCPISPPNTKLANYLRFNS